MWEGVSALTDLCHGNIVTFYILNKTIIGCKTNASSQKTLLVIEEKVWLCEPEDRWSKRVNKAFSITYREIVALVVSVWRLHLFQVKPLPWRRLTFHELTAYWLLCIEKGFSPPTGADFALRWWKTYLHVYSDRIKL